MSYIDTYMGIVEILYICYAHCTLRQHNNIFLEISDLDTGSNLYNKDYLKITGTGLDLDLFHAIYIMQL